MVNNFFETRELDGALSRQLVDHPGFQMLPGMLVKFRQDDGAWKTLRFTDYESLGLPRPNPNLPSYMDQRMKHRERFDLWLDDYATGAILLRVAAEHAGRWPACNVFSNNVGVIAAQALLAALGPYQR